MDIYKKILEYEELLKDGVITEEGFQKLKATLYSEMMTEIGIQDEAIFEEMIKKDVFREAILMLEKNTAAGYREAIFWLEKLGDWGNAGDVIEQCRSELIELEKQEEAERAEKAREDLYNSALQLLKRNTVDAHNKAIKDLESLGDWGDASVVAEKAKTELPELERKAIVAQNELESKKKKKKKIILITVITVIGIITAYLINEKILKPNNQYKAALELYNEGKYEEAIEAFESLDGYKDSEEQIKACKYQKAQELYLSGNYEEAIELLKSIREYRDAGSLADTYEQERIEHYYNEGLSLLKQGDFANAAAAFEGLNYKDSEKYRRYCIIADTLSHDLDRVNLTEVYKSVVRLDNFNNADELIKNNEYLSTIDELEGTTWQCIEEEGYSWSSWGVDKITVTCKDSSVYFDSYYHSYSPYYFTAVDGKLALISFLGIENDGSIDDGSTFGSDESLDIVTLSGDRLEIRQYKGEKQDYIICVKTNE